MDQIITFLRLWKVGFRWFLIFFRPVFDLVISNLQRECTPALWDIDVCSKIEELMLKHWYTDSILHYGLLDAIRAHGYAQMRPSIGTGDHCCAHVIATQTGTEKSIKEKIENSIFRYKFLLLCYLKAFLVRSIIIYVKYFKRYAYSKFWSFRFDVTKNTSMLF
jgi:hypothetical protein